jgi:hypothetical protein
MSAFGTGEIGGVILCACGVLIPIFGWWPLITAVIVILGWSAILTGANQMFHPNGSRKTGKTNGRNKRRSGGSSDVAAN